MIWTRGKDGILIAYRPSYNIAFMVLPIYNNSRFTYSLNFKGNELQ